MSSDGVASSSSSLNDRNTSPTFVNDRSFHGDSTATLGPPLESHLLPIPRPGPLVGDLDAPGERDERTDVGVAFVHRPRRVEGPRRDTDRLRIIYEPHEVEVVDGLLPEHGLGHGQRVLVQVRKSTVPPSFVGKTAELGAPEVIVGEELPNKLFRSLDDFATFQGLVWEIVVPLKADILRKNSSAAADLLEVADILDFPGVANEFGVTLEALN